MSQTMNALIFVLLLIGSVISSEITGVPQFDLVSVSEGYHGIVDEGQTVVDVQPKIVAEPDVCSFQIANRRHGDVPFSIHLKDEKTGEAELVAKKELNCEKKKSYKFDIVAISCEGIVSENVTVRVKVNDVNEYAPEFVDTSYEATVDEGRMYDNIITLKVDDKDCSAKYGDVCRYELLTEDQPFIVDGNGVIRNTDELDYETSSTYVLSVVAYDCGMKRSEPVTVTIKVNKVCNVGWKGIARQVEYTPGSGRQELFPSASLDLCNTQCEIERLQSRISLTTNHIGKGCDRDTFSVPAQRKLCGASTESIDLLPPPGPGTEWTSGLVSDEGTEGDIIYYFAGDSSGIVVPENVLSRNLSNKFSLSTWMKHKAHSTDKHLKEHILCGADDHKMNRHHFALFVRNCKLILLMRREYTEADLNTFQPAEWRWKLPQVCDNEWHHYSVQAQQTSVVLYVDGHIFHPEAGDSPEVIDDWPLHPTKGINTKVTIGACWQGSEGAMRHGLTGYLAGLSLLKDATEDVSILGCLTRCQESLDTPAMELLQPSMELLTNKEMTQITIEGDNVTNLESLLRRVAYINSREAPTPGRRPVTLTTNILCENGKALKTAESESFIIVDPVSRRTIRINGTANYGAEYYKFRRGLVVFPDITIEPLESGNGADKVDECEVTLYPPLNFDHEGLAWPDDTELKSSISHTGAKLEGLASLDTYRQLIRFLKYSNRKPAYYLNRDFKLHCQRKTAGGYIETNDYIQRITVIHPQVSMDKLLSKARQQKVYNIPPKLSHITVNKHHIGAKSPRVTNLQGAAAAGSGHAATLIVVVSIGFVVFLLALAAVRAKNVRARQHEEHLDSEMAWDDSAFNITVNPMELKPTDQNDNRNGEDSYFEDSEDDSSDEDDEPVKQPRDLEWDHSTLMNM